MTTNLIRREIERVVDERAWARAARNGAEVQEAPELLGEEDRAVTMEDFVMTPYRSS